MTNEYNWEGFEMSYDVEVRSALGKLDIAPQSFDGRWRASVQEVAQEHGLTPQETAIVIAGYMIGPCLPLETDTIVDSWVEDGKLNPDREELARPLGLMGMAGRWPKESPN